METVYIIDAVRTPIGKYGGSLSGVRPDDFAGACNQRTGEKKCWN